MSPCFLNILTSDSSSTIPLWANILILIILIFVCGIFAGSENIFSNCNKYHFKAEAENGKKVAKVVTFLINHFDETLIAVLIVNNGIQYIMSLLMSNIILSIAGSSITEGVQHVLSSVILAFFIYVFTDSFFKILGKHLPNKLATLFAYIVGFFYIILFPIIMVFKGVLVLVHKIFKIKDKNFLTREDFILEADKAVVDASESEDEEEKEELLEEDELKILNRAFVFDTINVDDVLKKKDEVFSVDITDLTADKLNKIILSHNYSRIPIYEDNKDNIIGIITVRTYFKEYMEDNHLNIRSCLTKPLYFKVGTKLDDIFEEFNQSKIHIGIVLNNEDKVVGIVTMDDILEELVGDINELKINKLKESKHGRKSN